MLVRQAIGLHVAQYRDREQSRRPHRPIGLLELDGDRRLAGGARVLCRPFALHDRDHRQLLVRQARGLPVAQHGNREQTRRSHWPIGLLELAGEVAGAADAGAASLAMRDQYRFGEARRDRRGGVTDMEAADRKTASRTMPVCYKST